MNSHVKNRLQGRGNSRPALKVLFNPMTIISLLLIGIFSFAALVVLSGYAGDLRKDNGGQATAKSRSAIGYAAYVQLLDGMGYDVSVKINSAAPNRYRSKRPLQIYSAANIYQGDALKEIPKNKPSLIILPKWKTSPKKGKAGWVDKPSKNQVLTPSRLSKLLKDADVNVQIEQADAVDNNEAYRLKFASFTPPVDKNSSEKPEPLNYDAFAIDGQIDYLQSFDVQSVKTSKVILTADGRPVLVKLPNRKTYILSEPDLLNSHGIATRSRARLAVNILDVITAHEKLKPQAAHFDLTIHGLGGGRNIIKLMTQPPFLAATLCLLAAGGIVAWQAFSRFGDPLRRNPDFAQGPVSLAKSAAEFMAVSNRVQHMAPDYARLTRQQVIRDMGLIGQSQDSIERAITSRETQRKISPRFADLTTTDGLGAPNLIEHARAMTRWKEEMMS